MFDMVEQEVYVVNVVSENECVCVLGLGIFYR